MLARTETDAGESREIDSRAVASIPLDDMFDVLRNARRRYVIREVASQDQPVPFGELVDRVAAQENGTDQGAVDSGTRKAVYTSLYQSHLPKLADMGVVVHDRGSGPVVAGPYLDEIIACLDAVEEERAGSCESEDEPQTGWRTIRTAVGL